ncbi:MAG TPA: sigma-70 family RNA polymerase sigma factor [Anaeromyxobacter sp.]
MEPQDPEDPKRAGEPGHRSHPQEPRDAAQGERQLRALVAAGDERAAATEAMRVLGPKILGYLRSILRDEADAGDAFSVWAEHLWRGIGSFRGDSSFRTWAFKIAYNAALNVRNEAWRRLGRPFETGEASRLADEIRTRTAVREERQRTKLDAIREQLTAEEQTLLTLRIDQQLSWEDIGDVFSASNGGARVDAATLRKRFQRLKDRLAEMLRERAE